MYFWFCFSGTEAIVSLAMDRLVVLFGTEILKIVPGRVSTEVDARFVCWFVSSSSVFVILNYCIVLLFIVIL